MLAAVIVAGCVDPYANGTAHVPGRPLATATATATADPPTPTATPTATPTPGRAALVAATATATASPLPTPAGTPPPAPTPTPIATPPMPPIPSATVPATPADADAQHAAAPTPTATPRAFGDPATPSLLDAHRIVSVYGVPGVPAMGILGASTPAAAATKAQQLADEYTALDPSRPAIPAFHLIVAVAQPYPGADGTYLARLKPAQIQPYVDLARARHMLLFLDVQVGWSDPLSEVKLLAPYLAEPFVHVALDPEFATKPKGAPPGGAIGVLSATQINAVQAYLASVVREDHLPPKILIVHQFLERMLSDASAITVHTGVSLVIDMDGFGSPALKLFKYDRYALAPYAEFPGMKLFYKWDVPMMTPSEVLALHDAPRIVIYQ